MIKETNISINQDRLWDSLMTMAKIGPGIAGGNNRQTVTVEDGEARELLQKWSEEAGMSMTVDELGSMFLRREGTSRDALPVVIGSHLDTQPTGNASLDEPSLIKNIEPNSSTVIFIPASSDHF